jgi:hypothetical protein
MITWEDRIHAQGDGYNGRYRFLGTYNGWCLIGEGGDFLTPGIGWPIYGGTPEQLLAMVRTNRPSVKLTVLERV